MGKRIVGLTHGELFRDGFDAVAGAEIEHGRHHSGRAGGSAADGLLFEDEAVKDSGAFPRFDEILLRVFS